MASHNRSKFVIVTICIQITTNVERLGYSECSCQSLDLAKGVAKNNCFLLPILIIEFSFLNLFSIFKNLNKNFNKGVLLQIPLNQK